MSLKKLFIAAAAIMVPLFAFAQGTLTLGGTIITNHSEQNVIDGNETIILSLTGGATWITTIADDETPWKSVFSSSGSWSEVSDALSTGNLSLTDDSTFTITLPASASYAISANETVTITIPDGLLLTGSSLNTVDFTVTDLAPVITINGSSTLLTNNSEASVIDGSETIIIDVARDTWVSTLGSNNTISNNFIAGITGDQNWSVVGALMTKTDIVRTSATRVTITLPAAAAYFITANETVTFSFPASSYTNGSVAASGNPTLTITNLAPVVTLSGTAVPSVTEANIRTGGLTLVYDVKYDTWNSTLVSNTTKANAFLAGITGNQDWGTVSALLAPSNLVRNNANRATVTLPVAAAYAISANESVSVNVPAGSFTGSSGANPGSAFSVTNQQATANVTWSTGTSTLTEAQVRAGGLTLTLDITSADSWVASTATLKTQFITGLDGGAGSDWNTKVLPGITVVRNSATKATITFPAAPTFDISALQTITYSLPDAALNATSGAQINAATATFTISPATAGASITPVSIGEENLNGGYVDLTISEDSFTDFASVSASNFTLTQAPATTAIVSVTNKSATGARLNFSYSGDIDVNGNLQITINSGLTGGGTLTTNVATVVAVLEPVITNVSIPDQTYKIGDGIPVKITVQNDGGQTFTLTSGTLAGRTLAPVSRQNATTYNSSVSIVSGTTDYPALTDLPVAVQMQVSGRTGNLYNTSISQANDLIDANRPVVNTYQALGSVHKIGDYVQIIATADQSGYAVDSSQTTFNGISINAATFDFASESAGSYYLTYKVTAGDPDVTNPAALAGQIVLKDAAGNLSLTKNASAVSGSFRIDAHVPVIASASAPDSAYITGETLIITLNTDGTGYSLSPETFINGISFSSGRFTLNGAGPSYQLSYPVLAGDAEVNSGNLPVNIVLKDAAGNKSAAFTSFSNTVRIYTVKPTAIISGNNAICQGDSAVLFVSLSGKPSWSFTVTDGSVFIPFSGISSANFSFKVAPSANKVYSIQVVTDNTGLTNTGSGSASITINPSTTVTITALGNAYSIESPPVNLSATPSGGQFSGPGVVSSQNKFYPNIAGLAGSPHTIMYTYTNGHGCVSRDSAHVSVVEASGGILLNDLYCFNSAPFDAQAFTDHPEVTGSFQLRNGTVLIPEGSGIHDNNNNTATITPALLSPGNYLLTYKYYYNDTLYLNKSFTIEFIGAPKILGLPDPAELCENGLPIALTGNAVRGDFSGNGVSGNSASGFIFDPRINGSGIVSITYSDSTIHGCRNQSTTPITIRAITPVKINTLQSAYNVAHSPVSISATPSGGVFTGPGVENVSKKFYPDIAGLLNSPHKILYTYQNSYGCYSKDSAFISIVEASGNIALNSLYCYNAAPFNSQASVTGHPEITGKLILSKNLVKIPNGSGIQDNGNNTATITPTALVPGDYVITYQYFLGDTLSIDKAFTIETLDQPAFRDFIDPPVICANAQPLALHGNARVETYSGTGVTGNSISGFRFDPTISGPGKFRITYTDSTLNGCKNSSTKDITVSFVPEINFVNSDSCVLSAITGSDITFTNTTSHQDSVVSWQWNFDDVNSGINNTSKLISPSHNFTKSGKYSINLIETTNRGCIQSKEITYDFGDKPTGFFSAPKRCYTPGNTTELKSFTVSNDGISKYYWTIYLQDGSTFNDSTNLPDYSYQFAGEGEYRIDHRVKSNTNCYLDVTDTILLKPTVVLQPGVPYNENFSQNKGSWSVSRINDTKFPGMSWKWGETGYDSLLVSGNDRKAWYIDRESSSIPELSYLVSPCYNLENLERPILKMEIFRNFKSNQDAANIQTSVDNGLNWTNLGNPGDGINWYSDYQTTNYVFGSNFGWANPTGITQDNNWVEARHYLDPITDLSQVQFRLQYGANSSNIPDYEGFAVRNITITERQRFSVLEYFTNTTPLNPLKDKVKAANIKVNNLYKKDMLYKDFVKLEYHTRFPSANDVMNIFNRDIPGARAFYYGVYTIPYAILDGGDRTGRRFDFSDTKYEPKEVDVNLRLLEDPAVAIDVTAVLNGNDLDVDVNLKALKNLPAEDRVLYVVLYETRVTGFTAENGETQFQNVVRGMLPDAGGTTIYQAFVASGADTTRLSYNFSMNIANFNKEQIRVAVYLQNDFTGEVYQAALSDYSRSVGTYIQPGYSFENSIAVFPNPATDYFEINVSGPLEKSSRLDFFDQLGRMVHSETINGSGFSSIMSTRGFGKGIYYLRLSNEGEARSEVVKLVIME